VDETNPPNRPDLGSIEVNIAAFEPVAEGATQREIFSDCLAAVLQGDYVIDLVLRQRELF
jgi:hypothetical protein